MSAPRSYDLSWMPLHVADWLGSLTVARLSMAGECAFMRLLLHQWRSEHGGLPADPAVLRALTRWPGRGWEATWAILEPHFPVSAVDGQRHNTRLDHEREAVLRTRDGQSKGGKNKAAKETRTKGTNTEMFGKAIHESSVLDAPQVVINQQSLSGQPQVDQCNPKPQTTASEEAVEKAPAAAAKSTANTATANDGRSAFQSRDLTELDTLLARLPECSRSAIEREALSRPPHRLPAFVNTVAALGPSGAHQAARTWHQLGMGVMAAINRAKADTVIGESWMRGHVLKELLEPSTLPALHQPPPDDTERIFDEHGNVVWHSGMPPWEKPGAPPRE